MHKSFWGQEDVTLVMILSLVQLSPRGTIMSFGCMLPCQTSALSCVQLHCKSTETKPPKRRINFPSDQCSDPFQQQPVLRLDSVYHEPVLQMDWKINRLCKLVFSALFAGRPILKLYMLWTELLSLPREGTISFPSAALRSEGNCSSLVGWALSTKLEVQAPETTQILQAWFPFGNLK